MGSIAALATAAVAASTSEADLPARLLAAQERR
jgi:hypothetical protein